jgi:hypothetical protein
LAISFDLTTEPDFTSSQAPGLSGMPDFGHCSSAETPAAKLRAFDRLRRTKLIARKHEELGRERAAEGEAAQPDLDAALNDNIACTCISGKTASDVSFWHEADASMGRSDVSY